MKLQGLVLSTLLGLLVTQTSSLPITPFICSPAPVWSIGDEVPMNKTLGQVTVVALLQASCSFCLVQAANMGPLSANLTRQGLDNVSYIIVNDQSAYSQHLFPLLRSRAPAHIPVYQQTLEQEDVWEILNGDKDDFLVYDRCGRLVFHLRLPYSYLHYSFVEVAIRTTYYKDLCGNCSFYSDVTAQNVSTNGTESKPSPSSPVKEPEKTQEEKRGHGQNHHKNREPSRHSESHEHSHPISNQGNNAHSQPATGQQDKRGSFSKKTSNV
ncbi:selenoprotein Pb-like [Pelobates fuscus]|uniref:selenoprotein Pb-like n=1 Tax=Pelobates fuscus TaxID=191477 RepID=UPI002FE45116